MFEALSVLSLPSWYVAMVGAILGAVMGSFLNVIAYRMNTGKSINGRSRCFSCGHILAWYELFPILSYLSQGGRCRSCSARIPVRDLVVEISTALVFVLVLYAGASLTLLAPVLLVMSILVVIVLYDIEHLIIPNKLVFFLTAAAVALVAIDVFTNTVSLVDSIDHLAGAAIGFSSYGFLWLISNGRWIGFGDAKLAIPLGFMAGIGGVLSMIVLSFWVGAAVGVALVSIPKLLAWMRSFRTSEVPVVQSRNFTMKSEIPFAPFIIFAFFVVYLYNVNVVTLISYVMPL